MVAAAWACMLQQATEEGRANAVCFDATIRYEARSSKEGRTVLCVRRLRERWSHSDTRATNTLPRMIEQVLAVAGSSH